VSDQVRLGLIYAGKNRLHVSSGYFRFGQYISGYVMLFYVRPGLSSLGQICSGYFSLEHVRPC